MLIQLLKRLTILPNILNLFSIFRANYFYFASIFKIFIIGIALKVMLIQLTKVQEKIQICSYISLRGYIVTLYLQNISGLEGYKFSLLLILFTTSSFQIAPFSKWDFISTIIFKTHIPLIWLCFCLFLWGQNIKLILL